jgi:photosystem II stability/assembly factor-like uncharacterized protein
MFVLLLFSQPFFLLGQPTWQSAGGLIGREVAFLESAGGVLFAGFGGSGIYKTQNGGETWTKCEVASYATTYSLCLIEKDGFLFTGTLANGLHRSNDGGASWQLVLDYATVSQVWSLAQKENLLFAGTGAGIFMSVDNGDNWTRANTPIPVGSHQAILSLNTSPLGIFAGTDKAVLYSQDNGQSWVQDSLPTRLEISNLATFFRWCHFASDVL